MLRIYNIYIQIYNKLCLLNNIVLQENLLYLTLILQSYVHQIQNRNDKSIWQCQFNLLSFDGYPEGVGKTLHDNWNDINDIIELIANGDISCLGTDLDITSFYADGSGAIISPTEEDYYNLDPIMIEYHYLHKNGEWICKEVNLKERFNESSS